MPRPYTAGCESTNTTPNSRPDVRERTHLGEEVGKLPTTPQIRFESSDERPNRQGHDPP